MPHTPQTCSSPQLGSAGWSRLPGHVSAGSNTCRLVVMSLPLSPLALAVASLETNPSLPRTALVAEEEGFHINHHYGQDATHMVKQIPVPLWHSPNEPTWSKRDSCWGYNHKNSMTLCLLRGSKLPPPQTLPGLLKRKAGCFLEQVLLKPWPPSSQCPQRHGFGVMSNAGEMKELLLLACPVPDASLQGPP